VKMFSEEDNPTFTSTSDCSAVHRKRAATGEKTGIASGVPPETTTPVRTHYL